MTDVLTDVTDGVLRITINQPERLNSVTTQMLDTVSDALEQSDGVRVAVLTGAGRAFCAGAVMRPGGVDPGILAAADRVIHALTGAPFPVIAAVNGVAAGIGCSLAVASDLVIAKSSTYFLQAFVNVGLMPDGAATDLLAASIGRARAMKLVLDGERLPADEAERIGLIAASVADQEFEAAVEAAVAKYAGGPTQAYRLTKAAVNAASLPGLAESLDRETEGQTFLSSTADFAEGVDAFANKRPANFTGK